MLATLLGGACSSATTGSADSTTTVRPSTTTTAPATTATAALSTETTAPKPGMSADEIAVRNTLSQFAVMWTKVHDPVDPEHPLIAATTTAGRYRTALQDGLRDKQAKGQVARREGGGTLLHRTDSVALLSSDRAEAVDCVIDDFVIYTAATMEPVDSEVRSILSKVSLVRESDGMWRIEERKTERDVPGRLLCRGLD